MSQGKAKMKSMDKMIVLLDIALFKGVEGVKATNAGTEFDLASEKTKACLTEQKLTPGYF